MTDSMPRVTIAQIQQATAAHFGLSMKRFMRRCRERECSRPRHIAMWLAYERGLSLGQIGLAFRRDRTTILHGVRKIESILQGYSHRRLEGEYTAKIIAEIVQKL